MLEKIQSDLKDAMKQKDELRTSVLRMLSSAIHNREIEKKSKGEEKLSDEEITAVIRSEVKKRRDAAEGFEKGGRGDAAEKEKEEAKILENYLPAEVSDEEIEKVVKGIVTQMDEISMKEFGKIMGQAMGKLKGQASGDRVSACVKKIIQE